MYAPGTYGNSSEECISFPSTVRWNQILLSDNLWGIVTVLLLLIVFIFSRNKLIEVCRIELQKESFNGAGQVIILNADIYSWYLVIWWILLVCGITSKQDFITRHCEILDLGFRTLVVSYVCTHKLCYSASNCSCCGGYSKNFSATKTKQNKSLLGRVCKF